MNPVTEALLELIASQKEWHHEMREIKVSSSVITAHIAVQDKMQKTCGMPRAEDGWFDELDPDIRSKLIVYGLREWVREIIESRKQVT